MNANICNPYVKAELEIYHHGIAGMKWGKKNGPPYPLGASDHSASEKKAGWRKSLNKNGQSGNNSESRNSLRNTKARKQDNLNKIQKTKFSGLSKEQKEKGKKVAIKALKIGGTIAVASAATYFAVKASQEFKDYNKLKNNSDMLRQLAFRSRDEWDRSMKSAYEAGKKYGTNSVAYDNMKTTATYNRATYDAYNRSLDDTIRELEQNKVYKFKNLKRR